MLAIIASLIIVGAGNPARNGQPDEPSQGNSRKAVASALAASIIYAVAIISAQQAMRWSDEFAVLWLGRLSGLLLLAAVFAASRARPKLPMQWWPFFAVHGLLDSAGLLFLLLGSIGELDEITSVVASTFTMVTVGLAWFFYRERISPRWLGGNCRDIRRSRCSCGRIMTARPCSAPEFLLQAIELTPISI